MLLNFLGINVLSGAQYDYLFLSSSDEQISVRVKVSEIAGVQPAVLQHSGSNIGSVVVALHHDAAANCDLADRRPRFFRGRSRIENFHLYAGKGRTNRADNVFPWRCARGSSSSFGEAIGLKNVESEGVKVAANLRIEARTAGNEIAHFAAEGPMYGFKQYFAGIPAQDTAGPGKLHHRAKGRAGQWPTAADLFHNSFVDEIEKLGHAAEKSDIAFPQSTHQLRSIQGFEIDDPGTPNEWQEQIGHLRERVKKRQNTKNCVTRTHLQAGEDGFDLTQQVVMGKHDALRIGGSA